MVDWQPWPCHNGSSRTANAMTYYTCFDQGGDVIARCQTQQQIAVLREMGRPISKIQKMRQEEAVVCSLTGSPAEYDEEL